MEKSIWRWKSCEKNSRDNQKNAHVSVFPETNAEIIFTLLHRSIEPFTSKVQQRRHLNENS
jgi:hypothetical protein